jgi:hypothetical protein
MPPPSLLHQGASLLELQTVTEPKIDVLTIDRAVHDCFASLGMSGARYVIVVHDAAKNAAAIGTNIEAPGGPERLIAHALQVMMMREPDICELVPGDNIGRPKGTA